MKKFIITASLLTVITVSCAFAATTHARHHRAVVHEHALSAVPVDLNTANVKALSDLKGIGLKKAKAIVTYRHQHGNFKSLADLAQVKGISKKSVARLVKNNPNRLTINR